MSWLGRAVRLIPVVMLFVLASSCNGFFLSNNAIESVTVAPSAVLLEAGATPNDSYQLTSTALTVGGTTNTDTTAAAWASSAPTGSASPVADVGTAATATTPATGTPGLVTAATGVGGNATATIMATDGGQSGTATVLTYSAPIPTTFTLNFTLPSGATSADTIPPDSSFPVTAVGTLNGNSSFNLTPYITWSLTANTAGATIASNGEITVPSTAGLNTTFTVQAQLYFGTAADSAIPTGIVTETLPFTVE